MNIDEITTIRQGGFPQVGTAVADIGLRPAKPCEHDFAFLHERVEAGGYCQFDVFFCRRCLEKREVKR